MLGRKSFACVFVVFFICLSTLFAEGLNNQDVDKQFGNFLHYLRIGRLDLAKATAKLIIDSNPDPVQLLESSTAIQQSDIILRKAKENEYDRELAELSSQIVGLIEKGRFIRRCDPKIIVEEIKRLSNGSRGWLNGVRRLQDAGEYSIMYMVDALTDSSREAEWPDIIRALPEIGRDAVRPLGAALQINNVTVKATIIETLGRIEYPQSLAYLKYIIENDESAQLRELARESINKIDPSALRVPAASLFYTLAENYYYHAESLSPAIEAEFANIWFWNPDNNRLERVEVDKSYFYELMVMRCCEWSLRADASFGQAIGLWIAAFFKAESTGVAMPNYFGSEHPDAMTYATTAGPEYLHQALARALKDGDSYIALGAVEALAQIAGERSLLYNIGIAQPLIQALSYNDKAVRYSAAIAIATAGPTINFAERKLVTENLAEALGQGEKIEDSQDWPQQLADSYALRSAAAMLNVVQSRNKIINLAGAQSALISATKDNRQQLQILAGQVLAYLNSTDAQRTIAAMALDERNSMEVRISAFNSLATSAKLNANLLNVELIDAIYSLVSSQDIEPGLRSAAAAAYGAFNLPSRKVKDLILDQSKS